MYKELSRENLEYIKTLPKSMYVDYEDVRILFAHGSPESVEEQIHPEDRDLIEKYTKNLDADALIFGHTHDKMWKEIVNDKLVINAGCAGVSPYYVGGAEYVLLDINGKNIDVDLRVVNYDIEILRNKIKECGILEEDTVFMSLTFLGIDGHGKERYGFFREAKARMLERNGKWYICNGYVLLESNNKFDCLQVCEGIDSLPILLDAEKEEIYNIIKEVSPINLPKIKDFAGCLSHSIYYSSQLLYPSEISQRWR